LVEYYLTDVNKILGILASGVRGSWSLGVSVGER
jgi:hypothetical protein